jgi:hypothetical protein
MSAVADEVTILFPKNHATVHHDILFQGKGATGATVVLTANTVEIGRTVVAEESSWHIDFALLGNGAKNIVATQTDLLGNVTRHAVTLYVTTREVKISSPLENDSVLSHVLVNGEGDPEAIIEAFINGKSVASATADWGYFTLSIGPLPDGNHRIAVQQRSINGEVSSAIVNITCSADRSLHIKQPVEGEEVFSGHEFRIEALANATLIATENGESIAQGKSDIYGHWQFTYDATSLGEKTVKVMQELEGSIQTTSVTFSVIRGHIKVSIYAPYPDSSVSPGVGFAGNGEGCAKITLSDGNEVIGEGVVDRLNPVGDAYWDVFPDKKLTPGEKYITATQITHDGLKSSATIKVNVVEKLPVTFFHPHDGETTGSIFSTYGTGTVGAHILLTEDSHPIGNATVDTSHNWMIDVKGLSAGEKKWIAVQTYEDGTTSKATVVFNVEPQIPFTIEYPEEGSTAHQLDPEFAGTGQPGARAVYIDEFEGDIPIVIAKVDDNGNWKGRSGKAFQYGKNSITIFQENALEPTIVTRTFYITPP